MYRIRHWLFDLDDTLYPASCGLFREVSVRITERISALLNLPIDEAKVLQRNYWKTYGTSLRGLILHHNVEPEPFLQYVHDVPVARYLSENLELRAMLVRLEGERHVFTNSPREHAERVLTALGVRDLFTGIFDIRHVEFTPKPAEHAYRRVLQSLNAPPESCIFIDDAPQNLTPARACGMLTAWLRSPRSEAGGQPGGSLAMRDGAAAPHVTIDTLADLEPALLAYFSRNGRAADAERQA